MQATIASPLGRLRLTEEGGALTRLDFVEDEPLRPPETPLLIQAERELGEYFSGTRRDFDLPLAPQGTDFQRRVWRALRDIPYGQTRSYAQLAAAAGAPRACRAVGGANGRNPLPILIPCHRVIAADGRLAGFSAGLERKEALLELEGIHAPR